MLLLFSLLCITMPISFVSATHPLSLHYPSLNSTELAKIVSYTIEQHYCMQVLLGNSPLANEVLKFLHSFCSCPIILRGAQEKKLGCDFLVYIAENIQDFVALQPDSSLLYSHFLVILLNQNNMNIKRIVNEIGASEKYFGNGRGILIDLMNMEVVYRYSPILKKLITVSMAEFNSNKQLRTGLTYEDFRGKKLKFGTFNCTINTRIGPLDENGKPEWLEGVEMKFVDQLSEKLNFSYEVLSPPDNEGAGSVDADKRWHGGLMKMLGEKKIDVAFCGIWMNVYLLLSDFTVSAPINDLCLTFLVPRPPPLNQTGLALFSSFRWQVWATFALQTFFIAFCIQYLAYLAAKYTRLHHETAGFLKFQKSFLVLWATLFSNAPRSLAVQGPLRHVFSWWAVVAVVFNTCFSSSLISHLTKVRYASPLETIEELVRNDFFWCLKTFPAFGSVLDLDDKWHSQWVGRHCVADPQGQCHFIKNFQERYAVFAIDYGEGVMTQRYLPCDLRKFQRMEYCVNKYLSGLIFQAGSPYQAIFSDYVLRYQECGIFHKGYLDEFHLLALRHAYITEVKIDTDKLNIERKIQLKLSNIFATFYLLSFGIVFSVVVFILELIWPKKTEILSSMGFKTKMRRF